MFKHLIRWMRLNYIGIRTQEIPTELIQTGALPWRLGRNRRLEVLLVTSRRSRRWTIPKGWPMVGKSLAEAAAQEAFEEAGVEGKVDPEPLGSFRHLKQGVLSGSLEVNIVVHRLRVERELLNWPEIGQRRRQWFNVQDAADRVDSAELRDLIVQSAEGALVGKDREARSSQAR